MNWRTNEQIEAYSWEPFESVSISSPSPFKGTCDILSCVQTWGRLMQGHEVQNALVRKKGESKEYLSTFDMFLLTYQVSYRQWRTDGSIYWGGQWESVSLLIKPTQQAKEKNIIGDKTFEDIRTQKVFGVIWFSQQKLYLCRCSIYQSSWVTINQFILIFDESEDEKQCESFQN